MYSVLFLAHFFQKLLEVRLGWPLKVNFWGIVEAVLVTGLMSVLSPSQQGQSTRGKSVLCELSDVGDRKMSCLLQQFLTVSLWKTCLPPSLAQSKSSEFNKTQEIL